MAKGTEYEKGHARGGGTGQKGVAADRLFVLNIT